MKFRMNIIAFVQLALVATVGLTACGRQDAITSESSHSEVNNHEYEDVELYSDGLVIPFGCAKATKAEAHPTQPRTSWRWPARIGGRNTSPFFAH